MPEMFSDFMATFFANMMPYVVLMQAGAYCWFMITLSGGRALKDSAAAAENNSGAGAAALLIALGCVLCPWRTCIGRCGGTADVNEDVKTTYNERVLYFPTDYDRENPLTKKQGDLRVLSIQIAEAEKGGDKEQVAALEQQKVFVAAQSATA